MTAAVLRADTRSLPLPDASVDLIVTSPPYLGLRDYGYPGQIGSEATPAEWLANLLDCTREWARVLKPEGSLFVNLGDKYSSGAGPHTGQKSEALMSTRHGHEGGPKWVTTERRPAVEGIPPKSLLGLPWRYALACTDQLGLILRAEIIWSKPNGLPESVTDRVRRAHEQVFHLVKQPRYYAAVDEIREPHTSPQDMNRARAGKAYLNRQNNGGGNAGNTGISNPLGKLPGSVWDIPSAPLTVPAWLGVDHFAAFPPTLVRPIVLGWSPPGICVECGQGRRPDGREGARPSSVATITGYACACPRPRAPIRPAVVVDPFGGTGTTVLVASAYRRHGISVDLSADYCRLARWRVSDPGERARAMQVPKPLPVVDGQETLFEASGGRWLP